LCPKYNASALTAISKSGKTERNHVSLERENVDTHPVGQRSVHCAAFGGATECRPT
jgi:hypothetical protein